MAWADQPFQSLFARRLGDEATTINKHTAADKPTAVRRQQNPDKPWRHGDGGQPVHILFRVGKRDVLQRNTGQASPELAARYNEQVRAA